MPQALAEICPRAGSGLDLSALSEQTQVDVEEDYQVCVKHLMNRH
jgi:hypothetical protein